MTMRMRRDVGDLPTLAETSVHGAPDPEPDPVHGDAVIIDGCHPNDTTARDIHARRIERRKAAR